MGYNHFTLSERESILKYLAQGKSYGEIARLLKRNKSSISREINRNSKENYSASQAQANYIKNKSHCGRKSILKKDPSLAKKVLSCLNEEHSPEQVSGNLKVTQNIAISFKTIYNAIHNGLISLNVKEKLRRKGKSYKASTDNRGKIPDRKMIDVRPKDIETRKEIGHYESDTIVGANHKSAIATYVERKSRLTLIGKMNGRTASALVAATISAFRNIPLECIKTFTSDNGHEFANFKELEKQFDIQQYFAFPHHPWERGSNENTNGLIRQYFPKGTDFNLVTDEELLNVQNKLNNRPRKCLGYKTPLQVFWECVAIKLAI
jgi:IS30 family transposase